jgi:dipeptidyl aminopeptidase/acylaminoacyl peptidase
MNTQRVLETFVGGAIAVALTASTLAAQQRPMTIVDLINMPQVGDPQLSPDGSQLLYVRTDADWDANGTVSHIWRVNIDGTGSILLTNGESGEGSARWSPDGTRIAFLAERHDAEGRQVYLLDNAGGEGLVLTTHATPVGDITWSPDGGWIYFTAEDEKTDEEKARERVHDNVFAFDENYHQRHLWKVEVATGEETRVTQGDFTVRGYSISRDGSLILYHRAPTPLLDDGPFSEIWMMSASGGAAQQLTENTVGEGGAELSPDNTLILFVADANEDFDYYYNDKLFVMSASGGRPQVLLPDVPYDINDATWSRNGEYIYFRANTGVRQNLFRIRVSNRDVTQITRGDHTVGGWTYQPSADRHAFTVSYATNAGDIWTMEARGRDPRPVTGVFDYLAEEFLLPRQEAVQWRGEDGVTVEGLLFYPLDYREGQRYPLVVQTHGGPAASDKFSFSNAHNYVPVLTAMGYMVFKPNYRGSTGYGDAFLRDMVGHYFNQAHKDVMTGVDYLIERGLVDGDRMAKMGWSGGGHMTDKIITYTDRFKAASSGAGAVDWISMYAQSDTRVYRTPWFGGTPWEENAPIDQYWADSPLKDLYKVTTPTIILVGENDARVPMPQSVELYRGLKANGVPTHLYVAPRQGHGWRELQQRLFKANVELDWFERWVRGREYQWEKAPVQEREQGAGSGK